MKYLSVIVNLLILARMASAWIEWSTRNVCPRVTAVSERKDTFVSLTDLAYPRDPSFVLGSKCSNQRIRKGQWFKHLEVFDTSKYGQGLRTTSPISKGTFLCEYVGEIITDEKFLDRMSNVYSKDEHHYTMKFSQNLVIDAYRMGNVARFANHSCSPNCEFQKWTVDGLPRMCMFSLRTIKPGEELTYDYNFQCFNLQAQQPCYCESSKCRGFIGAKQQPTLPSTPTTSSASQPSTNHKLTQRDKRAIVQSSIFLLRNLRRIKERQELRRKNQQNKLKQQSATAVFFSQNYYHPNRANHKSTLTSLRKTPKIAHKGKTTDKVDIRSSSSLNASSFLVEIFYLFYNHIRRSHFAKTGRIHTELIDDQCSYAQLAQLALILNEMFEMLINYRCSSEVPIPANALRKCPQKRLFPAYYEIIEKPIDLALMRNRIDQGDYLSFDLFEQDFLLLVKNAIVSIIQRERERSLIDICLSPLDVLRRELGCCSSGVGIARVFFDNIEGTVRKQSKFISLSTRRFSRARQSQELGRFYYPPARKRSSRWSSTTSALRCHLQYQCWCEHELTDCL